MEDKEVVEVEVLSETEAEKQISEEPKKNVTYLSKGDKGAKNLRLSEKIARYSFPSIFILAAGGLAFAILYSQGAGLFNLVAMITLFSLSGIAFLASIVGFLLGKRGRRLIEEEKNR